MPGISYTLGVNPSPLVAGFAAARSALQGFTGMMGKMAPIAALTGGLGIAGAAALGFKKSIEEAANMEGLQTSFSVLLGSAQDAARLMGEVSRMGAETPFELPELADSTRKLVAFGFAQKDVIAELRRVGDIASGVGAPISELAELYGKARVSGRLMAEDVNQLVGRGIPVIQEFAKQFGVSESQVRKLTETGQIGFANLQRAFFDLSSAGGKFGGMMEKQSQTWNGMMSTLKDNVNALFREFGAPLIDSLKPMLSGGIELAGKMLPMVQGWGRAAGEAITFTMQLFQSGELMRAARLALKIAFSDATDSLFTKLMAGFEALKGPVATLFEGLGFVMEGLGMMLGAAIKTAIAEAASNIKIMGKPIMGREAADLMTGGAKTQMEAGQSLARHGGEQAAGAMGLGDFVASLGKDATAARAELAAARAEGARRASSERAFAALHEAAEALRAQEAAGAQVPPSLAPAAGISQGKPDDLSDRLSKIGLFIGGSGGPRGQRAQEDTARNTGRMAQTITQMLAVLQRTPATAAGAIF